MDKLMVQVRAEVEEDRVHIDVRVEGEGTNEAIAHGLAAVLVAVREQASKHLALLERTEGGRAADKFVAAMALAADEMGQKWAENEQGVSMTRLLPPK